MDVTEIDEFASRGKPREVKPTLVTFTVTICDMLHKVQNSLPQVLLNLTVKALVARP